MPARGPIRIPAIACRAVAFHVLSWYIDDSGSEHACIGAVEVDDENCSISLYDPLGCKAESIEFVEEGLPRVLKAPMLDFTVTCTHEPGECMSFERLSRLVAREAIALAREVLAGYTGQAGREVFIAIGWNGYVAHGVGGEDSVRLPGIPIPVLIHTHPSTICYPSHRDVESSANLFAEGGIASIIVSPSCTSTLRLSAPLSEDDYWSLMETAKCLKNAESYEEYAECLSKLNTLKTVVFEVG